MLVEGAQTGGLAVDRRGRAGRPALPSRQLREEVSDVGRTRLERIAAVRGEVFPVLEQVGAVGVEGVAGEATLQLQVGEEVENEGLEASIGPRFCRRAGGPGFDRDRHGRCFLLSGYNPWPARDRASTAPVARGAAKKSGSSRRLRPMVVVGSPDAPYPSRSAGALRTRCPKEPRASAISGSPSGTATSTSLRRSSRTVRV